MSWMETMTSNDPYLRGVYARRYPGVVMGTPYDVTSTPDFQKLAGVQRWQNRPIINGRCEGLTPAASMIDEPTVSSPTQRWLSTMWEKNHWSISFLSSNGCMGSTISGQSIPIEWRIEADATLDLTSQRSKGVSWSYSVTKAMPGDSVETVQSDAGSYGHPGDF